MAAFNYKNAYKLAIQTNRELHISLDSYKAMHEQDLRELEAARKEIARLREEIRQMTLRQAGIE